MPFVAPVEGLSLSFVLGGYSSQHSFLGYSNRRRRLWKRRFRSAARVARRGQGSFAKGGARRGISQHEGVLYQEPPKAVAALTKLTRYSKGRVAQDGQ